MITIGINNEFKFWDRICIWDGICNGQRSSPENGGTRFKRPISDAIAKKHRNYDKTIFEIRDWSLITWRGGAT